MDFISLIFACANNQEAIDVLQEIQCEQDGVLGERIGEG